MIVIKLLGGLGNQLFQRAYGFALSSRGYHVAFDRSGLIEGTHREYSLEEYADLEFKEPLVKHVYEKSLRFDSAMVWPADNTTLVGYWQSEKYFEDQADRLRSRFNSLWMAKPVPFHKKEIAEEIYRSNSVFVHVRRQDYVGLQHFHGMPSMRYYEEAADRIRNRVYDPRFFVFSDDTDWCKANFPSDFYVVEGTSKHDDLRFMASCKHAIVANSSFSWWGAWIGDNQLGRMVLAPKKWFTVDADKADDTDIVPERWTRL
jgi:hypothetical protein